MVDPTLPLPGLSPVAGKPVIGRFDGGRLSSDGGVLVLREVERRLRVAERLAACVEDPRDPTRTVHSLADVIGFRLLAIAAGYEDGNDADSLRSDPLFKMALERLPSERDLCSQATISRLENLPDTRALLRMGRAMVDLYCASFRQVPKRIVLDVDDTFDAVHGGQQLRLFNAHYDEYGFQPIVVFDGDGRFVTAVLRPAKRPKGTEIRAFLRRLLRAIRANWPHTEILLRGDGHYACPEVLDWCEGERIDYVLGLPTSRTLRRHVTTLEASTTARFQAMPGADKVCRFKEFYDGASTWSRVCSSALIIASTLGSLLCSSDRHGRARSSPATLPLIAMARIDRQCPSNPSRQARSRKSSAVFLERKRAASMVPRRISAADRGGNCFTGTVR